MTNEDLIAFVRKNPVSVSCGLVALLCGLGIYFRSGGLPEAESQVEQKSAEGGRLALNLSNSVRLPEQLAAVTASDHEISGRLLRAGDLAKNYQYFYKLEAATGVKLIDLRQNPIPTPKSGAKPATFIGIGYAVALEGEYPAVVEFLRQLENGAHYCRIVAANVGAAKQERGSSIKLTLTVELLGLP